MHGGCSGTFQDGQAVVNKLRMMGFSVGYLPVPFKTKCHVCDEDMDMNTFEYACPECGAVHGVTPCHAHDPTGVQCAGVGY